MSGEDLKTIRFEKAGAIATLTMNRPDRRNAIAGSMMREMSDTLAVVANDPQLRVLILTGAGRGFCAGADLNGIVEGDTGLDTAESRPPTFDFRIPMLLHNMPAVTIAAVNGACAGAGFGWACACDLRLAAASARFNTAFLDVGVAGDMGRPWTLP